MHDDGCLPHMQQSALLYWNSQTLMDSVCHHIASYHYEVALIMHWLRVKWVPPCVNSVYHTCVADGWSITYQLWSLWSSYNENLIIGLVNWRVHAVLLYQEDSCVFSPVRIEGIIIRECILWVELVYITAIGSTPIQHYKPVVKEWGIPLNKYNNYYVEEYAVT